MGRICAVVGCSNGTYRLNKWYSQLCDRHGLKHGSCVCPPPFVLLPFPLQNRDPDGRRRWIKAINRKRPDGKNWEPMYGDRICSSHFRDGKPSAAWPDPTMNLGYSSVSKSSQKSPRQPPKERPQYPDKSHSTSKRKRKNVDLTGDSETSTADEHAEVSQTSSCKEKGTSTCKRKKEDINLTEDSDSHIFSSFDGQQEIDETSSSDKEKRSDHADGEHLADHNYVVHCDKRLCTCTGCVEKQKEIDALKQRNNHLQVKLKATKKRHGKKSDFDMTTVVMKTDKTVRLYTGIESKRKLECIHNFLKPKVGRMRYWTGTKKESSPKSTPKQKTTPQKPGPSRTLNSKQEFILVLLKLRLALTIAFLGSIFNISSSTASQIFNTWIKFLAEELKHLVFWPNKEVILSSLPLTLKKKYPNLRCTLDCTEVFIERPRNFEFQALTWSDYKKHNTIKFLVAIAPNGMISFLSKAWGGRASDVHITRESGFLNLIDPGDLILADRGFIIKEDLLIRHAKLEIPPPSKGLEQQAPKDVEKTKKNANARIHVERAIGRMKWFAILQQTLPISLVPLIDDIIVVCAALVNLRQPLVK
ncbi:uncharacterized protein LOC135156981 [Lytechinus pictus]|uniref:uncharacterized protein LOC135156981 n=1 Tax=Lytechinus pictus TaxID=7653 RepID=UPI0030B9E796